MEYFKIHSLYKRELTRIHPVTGELIFIDKGLSGNPLIIGDYAKPEFANITNWTIEEKVDGTNIRIIYDQNAAEPIRFAGRTDSSKIPIPLLRYLSNTFSWSLFRWKLPFKDKITLYGEGYGPKIQNGGNYASTPKFILFDAFSNGHWFSRAGLQDLARILEIQCISTIRNHNCPPEIETDRAHIWTIEEIYDYVKSKPKSLLARQEMEMEGVIARSYPQMYFYNNQPILFKLKCKDL